MKVNQVVNGGNVKAGFIPEEGKPQQRRVKEKAGDEDAGKNVDWARTRALRWRSFRQSWVRYAGLKLFSLGSLFPVRDG